MKNKTHVYVNNLCIKTNKKNVNIATIIEIVNNAYKKIIVQFVTQIKNGTTTLYKENAHVKMDINNTTINAYYVK